MPAPKLSVFPKCWFDDFVAGTRDYVAWVREAPSLGGEGVEHYDGFFKSFAPEHVDPVVARARGDRAADVAAVLLARLHACRRRRAGAAGRAPEGGDRSHAAPRRAHCRTLSGQRYPGMSRADGIARTVEGISRSLEYAERRGVVLCMENHYKDGTWRYPEFAQPEDIFLEIIERIDSPSFGVQYDPSNATVGGFDPVAFLEKVKHRVVSMHASDRYLAPGATLDDLREADGAAGYSDKLKHGETGKGLNDYDAIFRILAERRFRAAGSRSRTA